MGQYGTHSHCMQQASRSLLSRFSLKKNYTQPPYTVHTPGSGWKKDEPKNFYPTKPLPSPYQAPTTASTKHLPSPYEARTKPLLGAYQAPTKPLPTPGQAPDKPLPSLYQAPTTAPTKPIPSPYQPCKFQSNWPATAGRLVTGTEDNALRTRQSPNA